MPGSVAAAAEAQRAEDGKRPDDERAAHRLAREAALARAAKAEEEAAVASREWDAAAERARAALARAAEERKGAPCLR